MNIIKIHVIPSSVIRKIEKKNNYKYDTSKTDKFLNPLVETDFGSSTKK